MSQKRLLALRSFQQLPQGLQTAVQAHLLHGIEGPEACRMAGLTNPERTWSRDRVKQVLEEYRSGTGAENSEPSVWELVRQFEMADGGKSTLPADCSSLPDPDPEALAEIDRITKEYDRRCQEWAKKPCDVFGEATLEHNVTDRYKHFKATNPPPLASEPVEPPAEPIDIPAPPKPPQRPVQTGVSVDELHMHMRGSGSPYFWQRQRDEEEANRD